MEKLSIDFGFNGAIFVILLCLAFSIFIAQYLYKKDDRIGALLKKVPFYKYLLICLRSLALFLILLLLINPALEQSTIDYEEAKLIVLVDQSESINNGFKDSSILKAYQKQLAQLPDLFGKKFKTNIHGFHSKLDSFGNQDLGKTTNIAASLKEADEIYNNQNIAGIVIISDGIHNYGNHPLYEEINLNVPIISLGLGDTTIKKDIILKNVEHPELVFLNNDFEVQIDINTVKVEEAFEVKLYSNNSGKKLLSKQLVQPNQALFKTKLSFIISPEATGVQSYEIEIPGINKEENLKNNKTSFMAEILDGKQKVLITSAYISPDIKAIVSALNNNKNFEYDFVKFKDYNGIKTKYDLAIIIQPNNNTILLNRIFKDIRAQNLSTLLFINNFESYNYYKSASNSNLYPNINFLNIDNGNTNDISCIINQQFLNFQLSPSTIETLQDLPNINGFSGMNFKLPINQCLLSQRIGAVKTNFPLLYFDQSQAQKLGIFFGSGIWKWRLANYLNEGNHKAIDELINQTIQFLATKSDKRKFRVNTSKKIYNESDEIIIKAKLYNDNYEQVLEEKIDLELKNEQGEIFNLQFSPSDNEYQILIEGYPPGNYTYKAKCSNYPYAPVSGKFHIETFNIEIFNTVANHQLLKALSNKYNGNFFPYSQWNEMIVEVNELDDAKLGFKKTERLPLIQFIWIYFIITILLSTEWAIRKFLGGY